MEMDEKIYSLMAHAEDMQTIAEKTLHDAQTAINDLTFITSSAKHKISRIVLIWFVMGVLLGCVLTVALAAALFLGFS